MNNKISFIPVSDTFTGLRIENNQISFFYPETFELVKNNNKILRAQILKILRTFSLTKKSNSSDTVNSKFLENEEYPLLSYLWILQDYLTNHRYINRETVYVTNGKGKINWKRTMQQNSYVSGNNLIYLDTIHEEKQNTDILLTDIYKYCVEQSINVIGWLFNLSVDDYLKTHRYSFTKNKKLFCEAIKKEMSHSFEDNKRIRLSHMLNIITGLDNRTIDTHTIVYGVNKYDVIYEKMLLNLFSNVDVIKDYYPSAEWKLETDHETKKSSNLRPDIIIRNDESKKIYILDAKYYRFGTTFDRGDLPDTASIQKQITYSDFIKNHKAKDYTIFNAFLMPYNSKKPNIYNFCGNFVYVGNAKARWTGEEDDKEIVAFLIDTNYVIDNWSKRSNKEIERLCKQIEEAQQFAKNN